MKTTALRFLVALLLVALVIRASSFAAEATGYFRVEQQDGKWLLLDPDGKPFHLRGCNHYGVGDAKWREALRDRNREWGFTYLPPSVGGPNRKTPANAKAAAASTRPEWSAAEFAAMDFPFTAFLAASMSTAGGTDRFNFQTLKSADMPDVFGNAFAQALDQRCREFVAPLRENRWLIGYHFCHNPPWNMDVPGAEEWITACTRTGGAGLREWIRLMQRIYGSIERWRETYGIPIKDWSEIATLEKPLDGYNNRTRLRQDKEAFLQRICEQWHRLYHDTIRKYDPNHLILGDRNTLHLQAAPAPWAYHIMRRYLDVLSVNVMGPPHLVYGVMEAATRQWDGPILLADTGAGIYTGARVKAGYQARDLAEFEEVYAGMMKMSVEHPQIIGFGWCGWYETPQGRSGIVDVTMEQPIAERLSIVRKWNTWMDDQMKIQNTPKP